VQKNASNTSTAHSNLAFEEILSDNYSTDGPRLLSQSQTKLLSQQLKNKKVKDEKK
jgi:hypothetical protein